MGPMLMVMLAAAMATGAASPARGGRPKQFALDDASGVRAFEILMGGGQVTTIEFPEEMRKAPKCADCASTSSRGDALYVLQAEAGSRHLAVWPNNAARRWATAGEGVLVPVEVPLQHGVVTLVLKRVEPARAYRRVVFVGPSRVVENEYLRVEREKLQAEVAQRVNDGVKAKLQQLFRQPHRCERRRDRAREDDLVLEVNELCSFGQEIVIVFTVDNRGRRPLQAGKVVASSGTRRGEVDLGSALEFQEARTGVLVMELPPGVDARGPYQISLQEAGSRGRVVTIGGEEIP